MAEHTRGGEPGSLIDPPPPIKKNHTNNPKIEIEIKIRNKVFFL